MNIDAATLLLPFFETDKVLQSGQSSATILNGSNGAFGSIPTGLAGYCLPVGIYSVDGGVSWNVFTQSEQWVSVSNINAIGGSIKSAPDGSIYCVFYRNGTSGTVNVLIRYACLALPVHGLEDEAALTHVSPTLYRSDRIYLKVDKFSSYNIPGAVGHTEVIPHTAGAVTWAMAFITDNYGGEIIITPFSPSSNELMKLDASNLTITSSNDPLLSSITVYYIIYEKL